MDSFVPHVVFLGTYDINIILVETKDKLLLETNGKGLHSKTLSHLNQRLSTLHEILYCF